MLQARALVRKPVLKERLAGEVLEIRIIDPALAHTLVGQVIDGLEQQKPAHEPALGRRSPVSQAVWVASMPSSIRPENRGSAR